MGLCTSCTSTSFSTAKLILQDGSLQEFPYPVKVSYVLSNESNTFICNSDDMDFDDMLTAVKEDDELQLGQLYFVLPLSKLNRPLKTEEMAALAVKANAALLKGAGGVKCRCRDKTGFLGGDGGGERGRKMLSSKVGEKRGSGNRNGNANGYDNGRRRMFMANLSVIHE